MASRFSPHLFAMHCKSSNDFASEHGVIFSWTGTHWAVMSKEVIVKSAYHWLVANANEHASEDNAKKCLGAAKIYLEAVPERTTEIVIPCANGYLLIDEDNHLSFVDPSKEHGMRYCLRCSYLPDFGKAPLFEKFLQRVLPDKAVRDRVQEYVGYTLIPDTRFQRVQVWIGDGANGKGLCANIVQTLHEKVASVHLDHLSGFRLGGIIGASLVYVDELPTSRIDEAVFKSLVAGELVQVDIKYENPLSVRCFAKWLVLGNSLPRIRDHSQGFFRRLDLVPFDVTIPEEERDALLGEKIIQTELPGVLNWALEGLLRLLARGKFDPELPEAMQAMLHKAKRETNTVHSWADASEVTLSCAQETLKSDIYCHYQEWCGANGTSPVDAAQFWKRLKRIADYTETRRRQDSVQQTWCNLVVPGLKSRAVT